MILLNERQQRRQTQRRFRRYSNKYVLWAGQYYVGGADKISDLIWDIAYVVRGRSLTDLRVPMTSVDLEQRIKSSLNGVVLLGFGKGLKNEPVIFTVIEDRGEL